MPLLPDDPAEWAAWWWQRARANVRQARTARRAGREGLATSYLEEVRVARAHAKLLRDIGRARDAR